jgi:hypothetical protein
VRTNWKVPVANDNRFSCLFLQFSREENIEGKCENVVFINNTFLVDFSHEKRKTSTAKEGEGGMNASERETSHCVKRTWKGEQEQE